MDKQTLVVRIDILAGTAAWDSNAERRTISIEMSVLADMEAPDLPFSWLSTAVHDAVKVRLAALSKETEE